MAIPLGGVPDGDEYIAGARRSRDLGLMVEGPISTHCGPGNDTARDLADADVRNHGLGPRPIGVRGRDHRSTRRVFGVELGEAVRSAVIAGRMDVHQAEPKRRGELAKCTGQSITTACNLMIRIRHHPCAAMCRPRVAGPAV